MKNGKIAVIGAGNGGFATAADMTLAGWGVNLYEFPRFEQNLEAISQEGSIEIKGVVRKGVAKLAKITTDIKEAIEGVSCIMITTQTLAHEELARMLAPIVKPNQYIFIMPGSGGSLVFAKEFRDRGLKMNVAETLTLPYATRKRSPKNVEVMTYLEQNMIGVIAGKNRDEFLKIFRQFYPDAISMNNVLEIALYNPNIMLHPAPSILSVARIEDTKGKFSLYEEGFTNSIMKVLDALDNEIMGIFKKLDMEILSYKKIFEIRYKKPWNEIWGPRTVKREGPSRGPFSVKDRYITEDIPIGMVLASSVGKWLNLPTPTFDAIIQLGNLMNETNYWKAGRTLEKLGLANTSVDRMKKYLYEGTLN
jgi:opine dehydrogenase